MDKTGTVNASIFMDGRENNEQFTIIEKQERRMGKGSWEPGQNVEDPRSYPGFKGRRSN